VGLRYKTPVGPLRLDVGFPIDDPKQEGYQLHISIGQVF
jgi:outer membrane translocation and assembly module TamA